MAFSPLVTYGAAVLGLALLWKGADWLVSGSASLAARFGVSSFMIGLTVVSFGTSAPELFVNVQAAWQGSTELAVGSILGSNVANVLLILGLAAVIIPLEVHAPTVRLEIPFTVLATLVMAALLYDRFLHSGDQNVITPGDGLVLIAFFVLFLAYVYHLPRDPPAQEEPDTQQGTARAVVGTLVGLLALYLGGRFLVDGALLAAAQTGLSESYVGFAIVALGTSLPELAAAIAAARRGATDLVVGNVVGSNIFNLLWILGVTAIVRPLEATSDTALQVASALAASLLLLVFLRDRCLQRWQGAFLAAVYVAHLVWLATRA